MPHQRQLIRQAVKAKLMNVTAAADRVTTSRMEPNKRGTLPAISIYAMQETADDQKSAPRELYRVLQLAVEILVEQTDTVDDQLDDLCLQVERAMLVDFTLGETCSDCLLTSTEIEIGTVGNKEIGFARLIFTVDYVTDAPGDDDVPLDDLEEITVAYSLGGTQATADQASDDLKNLED